MTGQGLIRGCFFLSKTQLKTTATKIRSVLGFHNKCQVTWKRNHWCLFFFLPYSLMVFPVVGCERYDEMMTLPSQVADQ